MPRSDLERAAGAPAGLLQEVFPDVPLATDVAPNETLLSIEKARQLLGYEPRHGWRAQP